MTNNDLLRRIYRENKVINRNIQRMANIGLLILLEKCVRKAEEKDDEFGKKAAKTGMMLVALSEIILLISDLIDYRKVKVEEELEEYD